MEVEEGQQAWKMFHVVQLDSDIFKEKLVVPSLWLDEYNTLCYLPPVTDVAEVETLAKVQSTPKHGWQLHSVSFKQSFDTYSQAKENITKGKPVMIEEEEEQHHKEVRGKRKRKLPLFLQQYSIESGDDKEKDCGSTPEDSSMEDSVVPLPLIVKIETIEDSNEPETHQHPRVNITHNKSSSSVHSSIEPDRQLQVSRRSSSGMRRKNFAVVKFITEDNHVAIISSNWITHDRNTCRYPNSPNVERLLKKRIKPTPDWKMYPIQIMREYDSFSKAMRKSKKLTQTSNVSSDSFEELSNQPHKRQKPARYLTDSNIAKKSKPARNHSDSSGSESESLINYNKTYKVTQMPKNDKLDGSTSKQIPKSQCCLSKDQINDEPTQTALYNRMFQVLENINKKVSELNYKVDCLTSKVENITSSSTHLPAAFDYLPEDVSLPVTSLDELDALNNRLKSDKELSAILVRFLYSSGTGKSKGSFMLSLTRKVLTKEIAMQFSRYGRKGKKPFINYMETLNVILAAASLKFKEAEPEDLAKLFGKSLAGASEWNGGKFDQQIIQ